VHGTFCVNVQRALTGGVDLALPAAAVRVGGRDGGRGGHVGIGHLQLGRLHIPGEHWRPVDGEHPAVHGARQEALRIGRSASLRHCRARSNIPARGGGSVP